MELPAEVFVHNELLALKGSRGTVLRIAPQGYFELNLAFGQQNHRVLMPVQSTIIIQQEAETAVSADLEVEIER